MKELTILSMALFALGFAWSAKGEELKVGDKAPDFELQGSDGKRHHLGEFKGKQAVVLAWFPRAFTGGCTAECKSLKESGDALRKFEVAYFTASTDPMDGEKGNKAFAKSLELDYPILSDPEGKAAKAYGVLRPDGKAAARVTFYIDKEGRIAAIDKQIKTGNAGQDVAAKLKELGIAEKK